MSEHKEQSKPMQAIPTARDVMDAEYMMNGDGFGRKWTREELDAQHRMGDLLDAKLAAGRSVEEINAEWEGKTPQEILARSSANGTAPQGEQGGTMQEAQLDENLEKCSPGELERIASNLHFENDVPKNANRQDLLTLIRNGVRREGKWQALADAITKVRPNPQTPLR